VVIIAIETAMRRGEILSLSWADVFLDERFVRLHDTKNREARDVPLSSRAVEVLRSPTRHDSGLVFPVTCEALKRVFIRACKLAGIADLHFHYLRHEATSRIAERLDNILELSTVIADWSEITGLQARFSCALRLSDHCLIMANCCAAYEFTLRDIGQVRPDRASTAARKSSKIRTVHSDGRYIQRTASVSELRQVCRNPASQYLQCSPTGNCHRGSKRNEVLHLLCQRAYMGAVKPAWVSRYLSIRHTKIWRWRSG
jgi:Phage integrase family